MERATTIMTYIQENYWDTEEGLYSNRFPPDPNLKWAFMWTCGVQFSALATAARNDKDVYGATMNRFFSGMDRYWATRHEPPAYCAYPSGWRDLYYDDNAWMVITFAEAYEVTGDEKYLRRAKEVFRFVISGWDENLGGGIYWHVDTIKNPSKNTCSNAPSAVAALALGRCCEGEERQQYINEAERLVSWTQHNLQAPDGLYWDNKTLSGTVEKTKWTYNTALMMRAHLRLFQLTDDEMHLVQAKRLAKASIAFVNEETGAYRDGPRFSHLLVEAVLEVYDETGDESLLEQARKTVEHFWDKWQKDKYEELIENASVARMMWLISVRNAE